jgi:hypothetical protein
LNCAALCVRVCVWDGTCGGIGISRWIMIVLGYILEYASLTALSFHGMGSLRREMWVLPCCLVACERKRKENRIYQSMIGSAISVWVVFSIFYFLTDSLVNGLLMLELMLTFIPFVTLYILSVCLMLMGGNDNRGGIASRMILLKLGLHILEHSLHVITKLSMHLNK